MSTNSMIGIQREDGTITAIYCHWDGHLDTNGVTLRDHYTDPEKIEQLINNGDMSSLGQEIGVKHRFQDSSPAYCTFYGRDRHEYDHTTAERYVSLNDFAQLEYNYLWKDGKWECYDSNGEQLRDCATW